MGSRSSDNTAATCPSNWPGEWLAKPQGERTVTANRQVGYPGAIRPLALTPVSGCLGASLVQTQESPRGIDEDGRPYLGVASESARWKKRTRPVIRRTTFTACDSGSLNAVFSSAAISSLSFPDRNR